VSFAILLFGFLSISMFSYLFEVYSSFRSYVGCYSANRVTRSFGFTASPADNLYTIVLPMKSHRWRLRNLTYSRSTISQQVWQRRRIAIKD
jgi:hypothetical protein